MILPSFWQPVTLELPDPEFVTGQASVSVQCTSHTLMLSNVFFECICTFLLNSMLWQWVLQYNWDLYEKRYFLSFSRDLLPDNLNLMPLTFSIMKKSEKPFPIHLLYSFHDFIDLSYSFLSHLFSKLKNLSV